MSGTLFGSFDLDANSDGYFVQARQLGTVQVMQSLTPLARFEGVKKSGQYIGARKIKLQVKVVGISRANLISLLDAMYIALNMPQQNLVLGTDGRYFIADAVYSPADVGVGQILAVTVPIDFVCQQPYAFAANGSGPFDTGAFLLTKSASAYTMPVLSVIGGGTVFSRPQIKVYNQRPQLTSNLTSGLTNGNVYTSIAVSAINQTLYVGDTIQLSWQSVGGTVFIQNIVVAAQATIGATSISVNSFTANNSYPNGTLNPNRTNIWLQLGWNAVTIQQQIDNQYWSQSAPSNSYLANLTGSYLTFTGDPVVGMSVIDSNNPGTLLNFAGSPVTLNPVSTPFLITISAPSVPQAQVTLCWTARWLS